MAGSTLMFAFVNDAVPFEMATSPGVSVVFTTTGHAHVLAPSWMCAMLMADPAGKPVRFTTNVALAAVMLPAESFVVTSVIDTLPVTVDSMLVTGGTSFGRQRSGERRVGRRRRRRRRRGAAARGGQGERDGD